MIFVIDDDEVMAKCIGRATGREFRVFRDGIAAMEAMSEDELPEMIFLDILLNGPDGFTFLNELVSYEDTAEVPVVVVSSLKFKPEQLEAYGVKAVLNKDEMLPEEVRELAEEYAGGQIMEAQGLAEEYAGAEE